MTQKQANRIIKLLKEKNISFDNGLSLNEFEKIADIFGITFPSDLKLFLQTGLPVSSGFINWRYGLNSNKGKQEIIERIKWPQKGILFDIKNNSFWFDKWGIKPTDINEQKKIAINEIAKQPKLIPIYSHRYLANEPFEPTNPVFSVYQTDIIYYGHDIVDYFSNEFNIKIPKNFGKINEPKRIRFWGDLVDLNE